MRKSQLETMPFSLSKVCISHSALDKHLSVAHSDAPCARIARYRQVAVHYSYCRQNNRKEEVASIGRKEHIEIPLITLDRYRPR
jgi:K+-transporting ATPase c subunit